MDQDTGREADGSAPVPLLRVERGHPDAAELAALTLVVASFGEDEPAPPPRHSRWGAPRRSTQVGASLGWGR